MPTATNTGSRRMRPNDPDRRERIARAAISVVAERGIDGLTHRAVAARAEVPLGSTTYHFATLDDLLEVALQRAAEESIGTLRAWEAALTPEADITEALTALVMTYLHDERPHTVVEYDLYVAALHRPRLRGTSGAWDDALVEIFGSRTDPLTGRVLAAVFCGLVMQATIADPTPSEDDVRALIRRAVEGPAPA